MVQQIEQNGNLSSSHRTAQSDYWKEHSATATVEAMMLDSQAKIIDKQERPEVRSFGSRPAEINDLARTSRAPPAAVHIPSCYHLQTMLRFLSSTQKSSEICSMLESHRFLWGVQSVQSHANTQCRLCKQLPGSMSSVLRRPTPAGRHLPTAGDARFCVHPANPAANQHHACHAV